MVHNLKFLDWKQIVDFIEKCTPGHPDISTNYLLFRGHSNKDWKLEPSLLRLVKGNDLSEKKAMYYEKEAEMEFRSQVHILDSKISYTKDSLTASVYIDMQHYSCPTRLLDWSHSPYIGLYFAVNDNFETDGSLFLWDYRFYNSKMNSLYEEYSTMPSSEIINHTEYDIVQIVLSLRKNERIVRQQGTFSISNNLLKSHCDIINEVFSESEHSGLFKLEIPKELKLEFLTRLHAMNITGASLFPGLDGLGKSIREKLLLRKWRNR